MRIESDQLREAVLTVAGMLEHGCKYPDPFGNLLIAGSIARDMAATLRAALDAEPEPSPTNEERAPFTPEHCVRFLQTTALIGLDNAQARQNVDNAAQIVLNALLDAAEARGLERKL